MPEYLAPGVYVEETSFRSKTIEGVSTSTAGFIGPSRFGPLLLEPELLTSIGEFERLYGDGRQLTFQGSMRHNYLWHAVRAYFSEGGRRLYVSRVFSRVDDRAEEPTPYTGPDAEPEQQDGAWLDGHARAWLDDIDAGADHERSLSIRARYPGSGGNARVRLSLRPGKNILVLDARTGQNIARGLLPEDVVFLFDAGQEPINSPIDYPLFVAKRGVDGSFRFEGRNALGSPEQPIELSSLPSGSSIHVVSLTVAVTLPGNSEEVWDGLALDPAHVRDGNPDSVTARFSFDPAQPTRYRTLPLVIEALGAQTDGAAIAEIILRNASRFATELARAVQPSSTELSIDDYLEVIEKHGACLVLLEGGNDGNVPGLVAYEGEAEAGANFKTGLRQFEDIEDISIVAAPGSSFSNGGSTDAALAIAGLLITHAETMRYRIAVLDSPDQHSIGDVRSYRAQIDSTYAALYYPWIKVLDPITRVEIVLPPSGFVTGIYARNDVERAVYKAPANEVVRLASGFETTLNKGQQDVLNPEGVNCFRFFEGRGYRLWGARTVSSDPEWKYVNLRRYFAYLERSIDRGTQWAVFEPNGERLWFNVRRTVEDFLSNEFQNGALLGDRPERAFFVRCDRSTMTQNDLDNGRLVCLVGVAPLRPAEFVIFRIGQWTGDRRV